MNLNPCPFCGGESSLIRTRDISQWWYGECNKCSTRQMASSTKEKAAENWNKRHSTPGSH